MVNWQGMTPEEADHFLATSTRAQIEEKTKAHGSVADAARKIGSGLGLEGKELYQFTREMLGQTDSTEMLDEVKRRFELLRSNNPELADKLTANLLLDASDEVHKGWTARNATPFFGKKDSKGQQYQYTPLEMIGWKEVKSDLLFLRPVAEAVGININEDLMRQLYSDRVVEYFKHLQEIGGKGIEGMGKDGLDTMEEYIQIVDDVENGKRIMLAPEILEAWQYDDNIPPEIAKQVLEKGIGIDSDIIDRLKDEGLLFDDRGLEEEIEIQER